MKIKVISILLCLIFVVTAFAGCEKPSAFPNGFFGNGEDTTTTDTNTPSGEEDVTNEDGTPVVSSKPTNSTQDNRLVGTWNAETQVPITEDGKTVASRCTLVFKKDGTFAQTTTEKQAKRAIIDTYLVLFDCETEEELDKYIRKNKKTTLEGYVIMALANMTDEDFKVTGTWKTKNDNTLYETVKRDGKSVVETITYTVSSDGNTVKLLFDDGVGGKITMTLTKT
jgi:hypothetical protein